MEEKQTPATTTPETRRQSDVDIANIKDRLDKGDVRMGNLEAALHKNTELTQSVVDDVKGIVAFSSDLAAGSRLLCRMAKAVEFVTDRIVKPFWLPALLTYLAIYYVIHGGTLPDWGVKLIAMVTGL